MEEEKRKIPDRRSGVDRRKGERRDPNRRDPRWEGENDRRKLFGRRIRQRRSGIDRRISIQKEIMPWDKTPGGWEEDEKGNGE
jgi:hypothetical protein